MDNGFKSKEGVLKNNKQARFDSWIMGSMGVADCLLVKVVQRGASPSDAHDVQMCTS